jgi:hypothetical protein
MFLPISPSVADFDRDGFVDVALFGEEGGAVYLGTGAGDFRTTPPLSWGGSMMGAGTCGGAVGDVTGDGNLDILVADGLSTLHVFAGKGDGTFVRQQISYGLGAVTGGIALADINGDGTLDVLAPSYAHEGVGVLMGQRQPVVPPPPPPRIATRAAPNPFRATTTFVVDVITPGAATLRLFDVAGRLVETLVDARVLEPGTHTFPWRGEMAGGRSLPPGVYVLHLSAGTERTTERVVHIP